MRDGIIVRVLAFLCCFMIRCKLALKMPENSSLEIIVFGLMMLTNVCVCVLLVFFMIV